MRHLLLPLLLLSSVAAHAQTAGMCSGAMTGSFGIGRRSGDNIVSVNPTDVATIFGQAECLCDDPATDTNDLQMEILLSTVLPADSVGASLEVWVGNSCETYANRSNPSQTTCQQLLNTKLSTQMFLSGVASTNVVIRAPISASALSQPKIGGCTGSTVSRGLWIFIYRQPEMPLATCTMQLSYNNTGPTAAINVKAAAGDGAVTVTWNPPSTTSAPLPSTNFQLLCANADGTPVKGKKPDLIAYSTCLADGDYHQRNNLTIGGNSSGTNTDMGDGTALDMSLGTTRLRPQADGDDMGVDTDGGTAATDDGGTTDVDMASADMLPPASGYRGVTTTALPSPFTNLDPAYVCSSIRSNSSTAFTERITGLQNGVEYQFVVLAIDANGNATPSEVKKATPGRVENFYRRYASEGGTASGFCSATNEIGANEIALLVMIALLLGVYHRRRLATWWESLR